MDMGKELRMIDEPKLSKKPLTADMLAVTLLAGEMVQRPEPSRELRDMLMGWDLGGRDYTVRIPSFQIRTSRKGSGKDRSKIKAARKHHNQNRRRK